MSIYVVDLLLNLFSNTFSFNSPGQQEMLPDVTSPSPVPGCLPVDGSVLRV